VISITAPTGLGGRGWAECANERDAHKLERVLDAMSCHEHPSPCTLYLREQILIDDALRVVDHLQERLR
jgi:hypothetical protein